MNKYIKLGLGLGAGYLVTRQSMKYIKKSEFAARRMQELRYVKEFNELKKMVEDVISSFSTPMIEPQEQTDKEPKVERMASDQRNEKEESIAGAVKEVLDTPFVKQLIPDEHDMKIIKDVIDETAQVEQLLRSWFK